MIIVTGTKRSGTSLMMQLLEKAGNPILGEKFPESWMAENKFKNPEGFYEDMSLVGNGANNASTTYTPDQLKYHGVKIFPEGLISSDIGYIDKVIYMVRDWKEQVESWKQLSSVNYRGKRKQWYPDGYEWFYLNNKVLNDYYKRKYSLLVVSHKDLLNSPENVCNNIRGFLGYGRWDIAAKQVKKKLHTVKKDEVKVNVDKMTESFFDSFYQGVSSGEITEELKKMINVFHEKIEKEIIKINNENREEMQKENDAYNKSREKDLKLFRERKAKENQEIAKKVKEEIEIKKEEKIKEEIERASKNFKKKKK
jgi:hypothetical protein